MQLLLITSFIFIDPFCLVSFDKYTKKTLVKPQTLCPLWNETLHFDDIVLYGDKESILASPPPVIIELFDEDTIVRIALFSFHVIA